MASSDAFPNNHFSASSASGSNVAYKGRLNGDGAWSPRTNTNPNDYLQINLKYEFFICAVATQGKSNADRWTTKYKLLLSLNNVDWVTYQENSTDKVTLIKYSSNCSGNYHLYFSHDKTTIIFISHRSIYNYVCFLSRKAGAILFQTKVLKQENKHF